MIIIIYGINGINDTNLINKYNYHVLKIQFIDLYRKTVNTKDLIIQMSL